MNACFAVLTPPGRGALASIGVWGPDAVALVQSCIQSTGGASRTIQEPDRFRLSRLRAADINDEVVVVSHGGTDPAVEVICHGGPALMDGIRRHLSDLGAVESAWEDWIKARETDLIAAEAAIALTQAATVQTANHLLDQLHGGLRRCVLRLRADCLRAAESHSSGREVVEQLEGLLAGRRIGMHLTEPWQILVAGPVNAGKSSLINALVGYERSITAPTPGTTRDLVSVQMAIDGWPVELVDTAGWRSNAVGLEARGIAKMLNAAAAADLILWIVDGTQPEIAVPLEMAAFRPVIVRNKSDLLEHTLTWPQDVSARTGAGLRQLQARIVGDLLGMMPDAGSPLLFTERQIAAVQRALSASRTADWQSAAVALASLVG